MVAQECNGFLKEKVPGEWHTHKQMASHFDAILFHCQKLHTIRWHLSKALEIFDIHMPSVLPGTFVPSVCYFVYIYIYCLYMVIYSWYPSSCWPFKFVESPKMQPGTRASRRSRPAEHGLDPGLLILFEGKQASWNSWFFGGLVDVEEIHGNPSCPESFPGYPLVI